MNTGKGLDGSGALHWIGGHDNPQGAFAGVKNGAMIHAISDGTWGLSDGLLAILKAAGPSHLAISTWTAARADLRRSEGLLRSKSLLSLRLMVDRSFETRQPAYCAMARKLFGDDAIRVWSSHAKFSVFTGGAFDVLYLSSANLNRNPRLENHTVICGGSLPGEYLSMVDELFERQGPGAGFGVGSKSARRPAAAIYRKRVDPKVLAAYLKR